MGEELVPSFLLAAAVALVYAGIKTLPDAWINALVCRCGAKRTDGFDLKCVLHSALIGSSAVAVCWIDSTLPVREPERSFRCLPPATPLSWALPLVELGYALHDLLSAALMYHARRSDVTFVMHGALAVVFLVGLVCLGVAHHLAQVLVVHLSSLFLNLRRADFGARANLCVALAPWPPCGRRVAAVWLPCGCRVAAVWLTCG